MHDLANYIGFCAFVSCTLGSFAAIFGLCEISGGVHTLSDLGLLGTGIGLCGIGAILKFVAAWIDKNWG